MARRLYRRGLDARHYLYSEDDALLGEYDAASGALVREFVWLDAMPLAMISGPLASPTYTWITTGHLDEPLLLTDAAGAVISSVTRDPWGNRVLLAGGDPLDLGYPGQWRDPASGLFQNHHRDYDPMTGRYIEADPLGLGGGSNLYAYVGGDPINAVDPEGLRPGGPAMLFPFITGALMNVNLQLLENGGRLDCIDPAMVMLDGAIGGLTGGVGGKLAGTWLSRLPIGKKGDIGEAFALAGIRLRGGTILRRNTSPKNVPGANFSLSSAGARARPDFVVQRASGKIEVVEAKFGSARMSPSQRALEDDLGAAFRVSRTTVDGIAGPIRFGTASVFAWLSGWLRE